MEIIDREKENERDVKPGSKFRFNRREGEMDEKKEKERVTHDTLKLSPF